MHTLIIALPPEPPSPSLAYAHAQVQTHDSPKSLALQWAVAELLPAVERQTDVVALVPAAVLSWHRVQLPAGLHKNEARLHAALHGLLEDRLLDEPGQLHMALQHDWRNTPSPWVAVCNREWLHAHLQRLEQAGLPAHRIVPEFHPDAAAAWAAPSQVSVLGEADTGWAWVTHSEQGVWGYPVQLLNAGHTGLGLEVTAPSEGLNIPVQAQAGVVAAAAAHWGDTVQLMAPGQHWLNALASDWDLAQFELQASARSRQLKRWQRGASAFWHGPSWRAARWGLGVLLVSHLLGLQAWAWKTQANWQSQQQQWAQILRQTFPQTQMVLDAPLQMAREVERLQQASGQLQASDLESMLSSLAQALPPNSAAPTHWVYQTGQLRFPAFKLGIAEQQTLQTALQTQGYRWQTEADASTMTLTATQQKSP